MGSQPRRLIAVIKDSQHFNRVAESVQVFNLKQDYNDLCFVCARGHRVFAHKLLLSAVSSQMKQMFLELPDNIDIITIHLPDIEARLLRLMFDFLYEGALKLGGADYKELKSLMELLGIVLSRSSSGGKVNQLQPENPPSSQAQQQPVQPQAVFYMHAPGPNSQGQMQYVLAPASLTQGQMMQMTQAAAPGQLLQVTPAATPGPMMPASQAGAPGQMMQVTQAGAPGQMMQVTQAGAPGQMMQVAQAQAPGQMMQVAQAQAPGQMMQMAQAQAPGQMMQVAQAQASGQVMQVAPTTSMPQGQMMQMAPAIMSQANGQMVQGSSQVVSTSIQQNSLMQVLPQNNTQVMPMVTGNQMVQCSSQMVVQSSQPTMINNNQNQLVQPTQRQQYVMTSSANQMTNSRTQGQYTQPQTTPQQRRAARSRTTTQVAQPIRNNAVNNVRTRRMMRAPVPMAQNRLITTSRSIQRSRQSTQ